MPCVSRHIRAKSALPSRTAKGLPTVTLVLSCITRQYVIQVSDRRLTDLDTGEPIVDPDNNAVGFCKAVDFCGQMAFSYTGLVLQR